MPCFGASGLSSKGLQCTLTSGLSKRASAFSSRRFPIKHHGQTTSETTAMMGACAPVEASAGNEVLSDSALLLIRLLDHPSESGHGHRRAMRRTVKSHVRIVALQFGSMLCRLIFGNSVA